MKQSYLFPNILSRALRKLTYIIAHEEVIGVRRLATDPEQLDKVVELPMDVPANRDGALHRLHVPLLHEDGPRLLAEGFHLRLRQELALPQVLDLAVQIRVRRHRSRRASLLPTLRSSTDPTN